MKRLIGNKIRDTESMELVCGRSGDPNDCYSTFEVLYHDARDGTYYAHAGHHWCGLGSDTLESVADPLSWIADNMGELSDREADRIEKIMSVVID